MPAKVIVVGLDAAEATLLERWASEGRFHCLAELTAEGTKLRLHGPLETLPGAIWPELMSGRACHKLPLYYHPRQLRTGEAVPRRVEESDIDPEDNYWSVASRMGCRVAVVDVPQAPMNPNLNGIQLLEWGLHDRTFSIKSHPQGLLSELRARYGDHPVESCDRYRPTRQGHMELLEDLDLGIRQKTALLLDLLEREHWDLFTCAISETHCVGHQFWRFHDPDHPAHDPRAPERFKIAIESIYARVDEALGKIAEAAGPDSTLIVVASHGMGPYIAGYQMLREVLVRLGMGSDRGQAGSAAMRHLQTFVQHHLPHGLRSTARDIVRLGAAKAIQSYAGSMRFPLESPRTRAAALANNRVGAIRLNLKGREPFGSVEPGSEASAVMAELSAAILELRQPASGETIVQRVMTAEEAFGPDHHPDLPDLLVVFRTDLGPLEDCQSKRVGRIRIPIKSDSPRTGDHTVQSRLWARGPGIPAGIQLGDASVLDLAPTVLDLLGVPLPNDLDGRPIALRAST